ncbi:MAG: adenylate/guanylate cyclase domain-containing protein [Rhodospirillaceae bacterium]|nr:adenylate/guanylate cyclase domain-containing protein [Rhodospirillaceae bacterium]MBT4588424.1 adenylate/guanylate cyclase domain-containing protein [Rhodospirillaceae bacterium]MBT4938934.1 adenylate/guanylate cyclase domain-containing protein [Rhodospirillaceae bacterium]MBT5938833.1 adenylate/guanylate cyclase domain-containing protein [Rhodospirillaceae bacterium]MBT7267571.1 adenylate/guanylate cyclase domain-containing protein [Rhodospirillaceae bacterium]
MWSGIIVACYVIPHVINHALGLISYETMETMRYGMKVIWGPPIGATLLALAFLTHFFSALISLYRRSSLRMPLWEAAQIALGILIFPMILIHVIGSGIAGSIIDFDVTYEYMITVLWIAKPLRGLQQSFMLIIVWGHLWVGLHFWLRLKSWYQKWFTLIYAFAIVTPVLALLGFARIGRQLEQTAANDPAFLTRVFKPVNDYGAESLSNLLGLEFIGWYVFGGLVISVFIARFIRRLYRNRHGIYRLHLTNNMTLRAPVGQTILETLRIAGLPLASVCGGRGRCTTCRVHVGEAYHDLPAPEELERKALIRVNAEPEVRLACQARPRRDLSITPLLPPTATVRDANRPGGIQGREQKIAVMFIDLRGSTKLGEEKLPYDVLFILNQFFAEMSEALTETDGHYAQFSGDGLMALYGLETDVDQGCRDAIQGAIAMVDKLAALNERLVQEVKEPLRMGIGIHCGEVIVGTMGPPTAQNFSAIGDDVNVTARLESLTKEYGVPLIISKAAATCAGLDVTGLSQHQADVRGRDGDITIYTIAEPDKLISDLVSS